MEDESKIDLYTESKIDLYTESKIDWYMEAKIFVEFFIEVLLIIITIQYVSDNIDNNSISWIKAVKMALLISTILYVAKCINNDLNHNIRQGLAYAISGVFLSKYAV